MGEFSYRIDLEKITMNVDKIKNVQGPIERNVYIKMREMVYCEYRGIYSTNR